MHFYSSESNPIKGFELLGSKVFGYLKANRPILGIVSPADEMGKILRNIGVSTLADPESTCQIIAVLRRLLDAWSTGVLTAPSQSRRLRGLFSGVTSCGTRARAGGLASCRAVCSRLRRRMLLSLREENTLGSLTLMMRRETSHVEQMKRVDK